MDDRGRAAKKNYGSMETWTQIALGCCDMKIFKPADIMLPNCDMHRWASLLMTSSHPSRNTGGRCAAVGDSPSTLHMMLPEAELGTKDPGSRKR